MSASEPPAGGRPGGPESHPGPSEASPPSVALGQPEPLAVPNAAGPPSPSYPIRVEISYPPELNRWLPLVKWLLVIPHVIALAFVGLGAFFVAIYGFFAVLFTGRWPRGAFEYIVGTARW